MGGLHFSLKMNLRSLADFSIMKKEEKGLPSNKTKTFFIHTVHFMEDTALAGRRGKEERDTLYFRGKQVSSSILGLNRGGFCCQYRRKSTSLGRGGTIRFHDCRCRKRRTLAKKGEPLGLFNSMEDSRPTLHFNGHRGRKKVLALLVSVKGSLRSPSHLLDWRRFPVFGSKRKVVHTRRFTIHSRNRLQRKAFRSSIVGIGKGKQSVLFRKNSRIPLGNGRTNVRRLVDEKKSQSLYAGRKDQSPADLAAHRERRRHQAKVAKRAMFVWGRICRAW